LAYFRKQGAPRYGPFPLRFTPDSKWIVYHDQDENGKDGLFRVAISGGEPQRLGDYPPGQLNSYISITPDGRQFIVSAQAPPKQPEFWTLDNFLPKLVSSTPESGAKASGPRRSSNT